MDPIEERAPVTAAELAVLEKLLAWRIGAWSNHPDWDDLVQEARIAAWRAVRDHRGRAAVETLMVRAIDWSLRDFSRSRQCRKGGKDRRGEAWPEFVSLEEALDRPAADFVPALLERLMASTVWAERAALLTEPQCVALELRYGEGLPLAAIAVRMGKGTGAVYQSLERAVYRLQCHLGLEVPVPAWLAAGKDRAGQPNAAKSCCPRGHPYTPENTYRYERAGVLRQRHCRTCMRARRRVGKD